MLLLISLCNEETSRFLVITTNLINYLAVEEFNACPILFFSHGQLNIRVDFLKTGSVYQFACSELVLGNSDTVRNLNSGCKRGGEGSGIPGQCTEDKLVCICF